MNYTTDTKTDIKIFFHVSKKWFKISSYLRLGKDKKWVVWLSVLGILTSDRDGELWQLAVGGLGPFWVY